MAPNLFSGEAMPAVRKISKCTVRPTSSLKLLSHHEIAGVMASNDQVSQLFRECALAILNTGNEQDDATEALATYADFDIRVISESRGIKLEVLNSPASAFVDGKMIRGIQDHLFAVLRDVVFTHHKLSRGAAQELEPGSSITDRVFRILRNAEVVMPDQTPNMVVCWGGHSIDRLEYDYSKLVGYHLGLRGVDIATGCGIGAMKGPMKGAVVGHGKQQIRDGRYIGISEPGIIASESPNPTVNELVILPDIEKRLEAFVRLAHCVIVFPGGAGTAEEVLYLLGILMHPDNKEVPVPLIFAAPEGREEYFSRLDAFIRITLGVEATRFYDIVIGKPEKVAKLARNHIKSVLNYRRQSQESFAFNWQLHIARELQAPFTPDHDSMANLQLNTSLPVHELAAQLRCAFSGIVAGNVKAYGVQQVAANGPYLLRAEKQLMTCLDALLQSYVTQGRMKLSSETYHPCYRLEY